MAKTHSKLAVRMSNIFQANGLLITIAAVAVIVFGGVTLINNPDRWWIVTLLVLGLFVGIFLLFNAAVVLKVSMSVLFTVIYGAFAFQIGLTLEPNTSGGFIWLFSTLAVFFGSIAISYLIPSGQSRWSILILIQTIYFVGVFLLTGLSLSLSLVAGAGALTAIILYFIIFRFGFKSNFSDETMPDYYTDELLEYTVPLAAAHSNFDTRIIKKDDRTSYLVWEERAYLLLPVIIEQAFGVTGKRKPQLSYKGKPINSWLRYLVFKNIPQRKARGADIMLVLADVRNSNGTDPKVIGVTIPDTKAVIPVGVIPAKLLLSKDEPALKKALARLDTHFQEYADDLTEKQKASLEDFGDFTETSKLTK